MSPISSPSRNWVCSGNGFGVEMVCFYSRRSTMRKVVKKRGEKVKLPAAIRKRKEVVKAELKEKVCQDCRTTTTPLWRRGANGQRFLCNACGIRRRKRSRLQLDNNEEGNGTVMDESSSTSAEGLSYEEMKRRQKEKQMKTLALLGLKKKEDEEEKMKKTTTTTKKSSLIGTKKAVISGKKEVEEAALLLLSLSSGIF